MTDDRSSLHAALRDHRHVLVAEAGGDDVVHALTNGAEQRERLTEALAADPDMSSRNDATLVAAVVAEDYGFTDVDGRRPRPLTLADV